MTERIQGKSCCRCRASLYKEKGNNHQASIHTVTVMKDRNQYVILKVIQVYGIMRYEYSCSSSEIVLAQ